MYAQVRFAGANSKPLLRVPGDTVMLTTNGPRLAVVGADHVVHFRAVTLGEDLGSEVEILSGLQPGELVVSNPSYSVQEGASVDIRTR